MYSLILPLKANINFDYPLNEIDFFSTENAFEASSRIWNWEMRFIVIWCVFVVLFTIAMFGPKSNFLKSINAYNDGRKRRSQNPIILYAGIKWFCILILVSSMIIFIQDKFWDKN